MKRSKNVIFGIHPVAEAISSGKELNKVLIKKGLQGEQFTALFAQIRELGIPYQYVPVEKLNRETGGNHQGIIATLSLIEYKQVEEIVQRTYEEGRDPFIIVLDQITDVRNFGAIARTAECAGVDAIVIPEKGSVAVTSDAIKTSAGALNRIAVCRSRDLSVTIKYLQESGMKVFAATEKAEEYYYSSDLTGPAALVMGAEESGISASLLKLADKHIKIPLIGSIESLNVSVACGIIAFELVKQRKNS